MATAKVSINGNTVIDISDTTAASDGSDLRSGKTMYNAAGVKVNGSLDIITYYTGTTDPSPSLGNVGDIYLKVAT